MNVSPFNWRTGPSQIAAQLITPGWGQPKPIEKIAAVEDVDLDALRRFRAADHTLAECATEFGKSVNTIRKLLQERTSKRSKTVSVTADEILSLRNEGYSWRELARRFSCAPSTLRDRVGEKSSPEVLAKVKARYAKPACKHGKGRQIYMTDAQYAAFQALGGGDWLRSVLAARSTAGAR